MGEDAPPPPSFPPCRRDSPHFTGEKIGVQSGEATRLSCRAEVHTPKMCVFNMRMSTRESFLFKTKQDRSLQMSSASVPGCSSPGQQVRTLPRL